MPKRDTKQNPYKLTFENALDAAGYLIRGEHPDSKLCEKCLKTLEMIRELRKRFKDHAINNNLVWYAFREVDGPNDGKN